MFADDALATGDVTVAVTAGAGAGAAGATFAGVGAGIGGGGGAVSCTTGALASALASPCTTAVLGKLVVGACDGGGVIEYELETTGMARRTRWRRTTIRRVRTSLRRGWVARRLWAVRVGVARPAEAKLPELAALAAGAACWSWSFGTGMVGKCATGTDSAGSGTGTAGASISARIDAADALA